MIVGGIDPSGTPRRPSGLALIDTASATVVYAGLVYRDEEIVGTILRYKPVIVAIDSPLSPTTHGFRQVDLVMKRKGYPVLPPSWRGMRMLVTRSLRIMEILNRHGIGVIETHPRSALKSSNCLYVEELFDKVLRKYDRRWLSSKDVCDALIASIVAKYYVEGRALPISAPDGVIYLLPKVCSNE